MPTLCHALVFAALLSSAAALPAQTPPNAPAPGDRPRPELSTHPEWPRPSASDAGTIVSTIHAFYSAISAPAGGRLNRQRLLSLFVPGGRIAVALSPRAGRAADVLFLTPEQYAASSDAQTATSGFFDHNMANQVEQFGVIAHVFSTYESRTAPTDPTPMRRGIKSFDLLNSNGRWYIVQVYWYFEQPGNSIPDRYLHDHED